MGTPTSDPGPAAEPSPTDAEERGAGAPALPGRQLPRPLRLFLRTESAGGLVLLAATVVALVWANSPWDAGYESLWRKPVELRIGGLHFQEDLRHAVNEGLMALFFFVAGLEIKRELIDGELREWRQAALPVVAALGGMVVPAALYALCNVGQPGSRGWGIPMATDIAFALGLVALLGNRVPSGVRVFLLTLAIVDDVGAIIVIAVFYSAGVEWAALGVAAALVGVMAGLRAGRVLWMPAYLLVGFGVWLATYQSGIHATIAGAVLGLLAPARPMTAAAVTRDWAQDLSDEPGPEELRTMSNLATNTVSVAERLEHALHPVVSFAVVPLFALANAGVALGGDALDEPGAGLVAAGVVLGLVVGKAVGVGVFAWMAVRLRVASLPEGVGWRQVAGIGATAGIGFTVSLFVADLAFPATPLEAAAKVAILGGSLVASVVGALLLGVGGGPAGHDSEGSTSRS